jgi:hypothetical protein
MSLYLARSRDGRLLVLCLEVCHDHERGRCYLIVQVPLLSYVV